MAYDNIQGYIFKNQDSSVSITVDYRLDDQGSISGGGEGERDFTLLCSVQVDPGAYSASSPIGNGELFPRSKAAGA
jgi:hypothetical protein